MLPSNYDDYVNSIISGGNITINVAVHINNTRKFFTARKNSKVYELKEMVAERFDMLPSEVVLTYCGQFLEDEGSLCNHGIGNGHVINLEWKPIDLNAEANDSRESLNRQEFSRRSEEVHGLATPIATPQELKTHLSTVRGTEISNNTCTLCISENSSSNSLSKPTLKKSRTNEIDQRTAHDQHFDVMPAASDEHTLIHGSSSDSSLPSSSASELSLLSSSPSADNIFHFPGYNDLSTLQNINMYFQSHIDMPPTSNPFVSVEYRLQQTFAQATAKSMRIYSNPIDRNSTLQPVYNFTSMVSFGDRRPIGSALTSKQICSQDVDLISCSSFAKNNNHSKALNIFSRSLRTMPSHADGMQRSWDIPTACWHPPPSTFSNGQSLADDIPVYDNWVSQLRSAPTTKITASSRSESVDSLNDIDITLIPENDDEMTLVNAFKAIIERTFKPSAGFQSFEEQYADELSILRKMGFPDVDRNIQALNVSNGGVLVAMQHLLRIQKFDG